MRAAISRCYGPPSVVRLEEIDRPAVGDAQVLVKVHAASVNPLDLHHLRGTPYIGRMSSGPPKTSSPALKRVTPLPTAVTVPEKSTPRRGSQGLPKGHGSFGEYVTVQETGAITLRPPEVPVDQAAAVAIAGITALQALRDKGHVHAGDKVLINGASGSVGIFAVQIAKSFGAEVTGVCSTGQAGLIRSLGADHVIDYTEDFTRGTMRYDLIIDNVGSHSVMAYRRVLQPQGRLVIVGGPPGDWIRPLAGPLQAMVLAPFSRQPLLIVLADLKQQDLATLAALMQAGGD